MPDYREDELKRFSIIPSQKGAPAIRSWRLPQYFWQIGTIIGGYYPIRGYFGLGGFGQVYRCYDEAIHKDIAVKIPHPVNPQTGKRFVDNPGQKENLLREVRLWIELAHPHIVHAFDIIDDQTTSYLPAIFMESCAGGNLEACFCQNRSTLADRLDAAIQICWAMEYAHSQGMLHLDLKPQNVLLTDDGRVKVTDFGLSRAMSDSKTGNCGTPYYMSPEQWEGTPQKTSDIYSFGIMLYEMVYGRLPFMPDVTCNRANWLRKLQELHCDGKPQIPICDDIRIPVKLSELILSCLEKKLQDRPQDFGVVAKALCDCYGIYLKCKYSRVKPIQEAISRDRLFNQAWALIRFGVGCDRRGDLKEAMDIYQQAGEKFKTIQDKSGLSTCIGNQALVLYAWGQIEEAMKLLKQQEALCKELGDDACLSGSLCNQGLILHTWGRLEEAMKLRKQEESLSKELGNKAGLSRSLGGQANILYKWGRLEEAMKLHKQQEALCKELGNKAGLARSLGNQAVILVDWDRIEEAMQLLKQQEALYNELGDKAELSGSLCNQAVILYAWGRPEEAMQLHKQEEALCEELGDKAGLAESLFNQAVILYTWSRPEEAMQLHKQEEALCEELGNKAGLARSLGNQALILKDWGQLEEAMKLHKQEEALCNELGDKTGLASSLGNQGLILYAWGRLEEAMQLHKQEEALCEELGNKAGLARSLGNQAAILVAWDRLEEAIELYIQEEVLCFELDDKAGLSRNWINQAYLLAFKLNRKGDALTWAREAYQIANQCGFKAQAQQIKNILEQIKSLP